MNYTQAQIDRANAVSLEDFLHTQGETLIKSGREYRWKEHDSLTVRGKAAIPLISSWSFTESLFPKLSNC